MAILPNTEAQGGSSQIGGWQDICRKRHQKGSLRKRGTRNPVWEFQWWKPVVKPDGTLGRERESRILGSTAELSKKQAQKAGEELLRPLNSGTVTPFSGITLAEFVTRYYEQLCMPTLKQSTQQRYRGTLNKHLLPAFGKMRLDQITTQQIQAFVLGKMQGGLGWQMADHFRNLLSRIFYQAKRFQLFYGDNPASGIELPERRGVRELHVLTSSQVAQLVQTLDEPSRTMVLLAVHTGMRVGELLGLEWQDVDFNERRLHVQRATYRGNPSTPKTKHSNRFLHLNAVAFAALQAHRSRSLRTGTSDLIFQTSAGTPYLDGNVLKRKLKPAGKRVGAPWLTWHTLRRTFATLLVSNRATVKDVQALLGHAKSSTTLDIYAFALPDSQREAVEKLGLLVTNGDELALAGMRPPQAVLRIQ